MVSLSLRAFEINFIYALTNIKIDHQKRLQKKLLFIRLKFAFKSPMFKIIVFLEGFQGL